MQPHNPQTHYQLSAVDRKNLVPANIKYINDQLPRRLAASLANMPPKSPFITPGMKIDEAIAKLTSQALSFRIAKNSSSQSEVNSI